jgi:ABC-type enterochelin transport system permease subunit
MQVYRNFFMRERIVEVVQWAGAASIIVMHVLNAVGPAAYPYNIISASAGTVCFMFWAYNVRNKPQFIVNIVALIVCGIGLYKAFWS